MHPLAPDLSKLNDDELQTKILDLQGKLAFAYRMGHTDLVLQMQLLLDDFIYEQQKRNQKMLEDLQKNNKNFADKIDIAK